MRKPQRVPTESPEPNSGASLFFRRDRSLVRNPIGGPHQAPLEQVPNLGSSLNGVVREGGFAETFAELLRKSCGTLQNTFYCIRKECGNSAECLWKFCENVQTEFCNDALWNNARSELRTIV